VTSPIAQDRLVVVAEKADHPDTFHAEEVAMRPIVIRNGWNLLRYEISLWLILYPNRLAHKRAKPCRKPIGLNRLSRASSATLMS
jgi:hypothetical protein